LRIFYAGAVLACKTYACLIVGGDTITSPANAMISITVAGEAELQAWSIAVERNREIIYV